MILFLSKIIFTLFLLVVLAAWFRLKYPHIAIGALASSAPILQFDVITPWSSFYDAVSQDYKVSLLNNNLIYSDFQNERVVVTIIIYRLF